MYRCRAMFPYWGEQWIRWMRWMDARYARALARIDLAELTAGMRAAVYARLAEHGSR